MNCGLPKTNVVCLYAIPEAATSTAMRELRSYFDKKRGFDTSHYNENVTLDELRAIPRDCSVFFLTTHGVRDPDTKVFWGIETATLAKDARAKYGQDFEDRLIIPLGGDDTICAITYDFIKKYWNFADNSFVFINGCGSFDSKRGERTLARIILDHCNASVFGGWTRESTGGGDDAVLYLFDRLLGTNAKQNDVHKEIPDQRPFTWELVKERMAALGLDDVIVLEEKTSHSKMQIVTRGKGDFGILAPSIGDVEINETDKTVTLHGFFGKDQSKIRVFVRERPEAKKDSSGGYELVRGPLVDAWTMVCEGITDSGAGSAGYIVAAVDYGGSRLVESNPVPITAWKGKFTYTLRLPGQDSGDGIAQITASVFLRGDIHRMRNKPGGELLPRPCGFALVEDETVPVHYRSSGRYSHDDRVYVWRGSGTTNPADHGLSGSIEIFCLHRHLPELDHPKLFVLLCTGPEALVKVTDDKGNVIIPEGMSLISTADLMIEMDADNPFPDFLNGSVTWAEAGSKYESSYNIPGDAIKKPVVYGLISSDQKILTAELKWETLEAKYAPDDTTLG